VVAVAAVDDVDAFATGQQVVAAAAEDVVAAGAGEHGVVAFAAVDAVVAGTGGDGVVALAALDHDVDPDVGRDLDHVVAVARTDRQLLPLIEMHLVVLAVDADGGRAVVALLAAEAVVAGAGGEHQLVAADLVPGVDGAFARHLQALVGMQRVDHDRLAVDRA